MRFSVLLVIWLAGVRVFAQDTTTAPSGSASSPNPIVNLASDFFEHDYFNVYAFANGTYDTYTPVIQNNNPNINYGGFGFQVGGGINAYHSFRDGNISVDYSGSYSNYQNGFSSSGTNQSLGLGYTKRLTRRWMVSVNADAGIWLYGGTFGSLQPTATTPNAVTGPANAVIPNPFSPETRFVSGGVNVSYRQTRRLSYILGGSFALTRYNFPGSIGATGGSASAGVQYQLGPRTTILGNYGYTHFVYTGNQGQASVNSVSATLSHQFASHWQVSLSGGYSRSNASGVVAIPVTFIVGTGSTQQLVGGYILGPYNQTANVPNYGGSVSRAYRRSTLSFSAGSGVSGTGNGYFLTSRTVYVNGFYSRSIQRRTNVGFGGTYYRLSSLANTVSSTYSTASFSANYATMLMRYLGVFLRYDYLRYGSLSPSSGVKDSRISFGFNFSSKGIPMTLF